MSTLLEITQLDDGDVVLRDADETAEPLLRISFSAEVKDMLGDDLIGVAEAMIDAATDFLEDGSAAYDKRYDAGSEDGDDHEEGSSAAQPPVVH